MNSTDRTKRSEAFMPQPQEGLVESICASRQPALSETAEAASATEITAALVELYDIYYLSGEYRHRYPKPNRSTLEFLLKHGAASATRILDFGCGNGRYALPLLQRTNARVVGFDISQAAIDEFAGYLRGSPLATRATLFCGNAELLERQGQYDLIMLLFGVLSHVGERADRVRTLRQMRRLLADRGTLILSVPSVFRRRPRNLLYAALRRASGTATKSQKEPGNIFLVRNIADARRRMFYHLYSLKGLEEELQESGFALRVRTPESLLPEWAVTQSNLLGKIDAALLSLLPPSLGYGIRVAADPV